MTTLYTKETELNQNTIVSELTRSPHGKLDQYAPVAIRAVEQFPEFYAHLIAYNEKNGQIRDSKVALPVIGLTSKEPDFVENALAHMARLSPRDFLRSVRFAFQMRPEGKGMSVRRLVERYLRFREADRGWFDSQAMQHRDSLKALYALIHLKPSEYAQQVLNYRTLDKKTTGAPSRSKRAILGKLKDMSPQEAAGTIVEQKIPFLMAAGAMKSRIKDPDVLLALISRMSPNELITNSKLLDKYGIKTNPILKAAYEKGLEKVSKSKTNILKATRATESQDLSESTKEKLKGAQERQLASMKGVEGDWLILTDASGSMQHAIEMATKVASILAKMGRGKVHLIFFDTTARYMDVSGLTYEEISAKTKHVRAGGGTSIGCGVRYAIDAKLDVDGVVVITDCGENSTPYFRTEFPKLETFLGKSVPVYLFYVAGGGPNFALSVSAPAIAWVRDQKQYGIDVQHFDVPESADFYSLPETIKLLRTNRYGLVNEIMDTPLLTLEEVFTVKEKHVTTTS